MAILLWYMLRPFPVSIFCAIFFDPQCEFFYIVLTKKRVLAHFSPPALSHEDIAKLKDKNTWFEISYFTQKIQAATAKKVAQTIEDHPDAEWVMVSESDQTGNPTPEVLRNFRDLLLEQGIGQGLLNNMMITTPEELLYE